MEGGPRGGPWTGVQGVVHGLGVSVFNSPLYDNPDYKIKFDKSKL